MKITNFAYGEGTKYRGGLLGFLKKKTIIGQAILINDWYVTDETLHDHENAVDSAKHKKGSIIPIYIDSNGTKLILAMEPTSLRKYWCLLEEAPVRVLGMNK